MTTPKLDEDGWASEWSEIECPCCGDIALSGRWFIDGSALICGCNGSLSVDSENEPYVNIGDCDCQERAELEKRLGDGHLAILSMPWRWEPEFQDDGAGGPDCPFCGCCAEEEHGVSDQGHDCPWLISARACGIADDEGGR